MAAAANYEQVPISPGDAVETGSSPSSPVSRHVGQSKAQLGRFITTTRFKLIAVLTLVAVGFLLFWTVSVDHSVVAVSIMTDNKSDKDDEDDKNNNNKPLTEEEKYMLDKLPVLPPYAATPFAATTEPAAAASASKPWLNAIMISSKDVQRRALIRSSWLRLYKDVPFDYVFVLGNPSSQSTGEHGWGDVVAAENRTYGDLVVLDRVYEGARHANTYKSVEFFRWLALRPWRNTYAWVSKVDSDSFVEARGFYAKYIEPRLVPGADPARATSDPSAALTFIGRKCEAQQWYWAGGQFYTMSRDLVELLPRLQDLGGLPHPNPDEDIRNAMILKSHGYDFDLIILPNEEAFDYNENDSRGNNTGWAVDNARQGEWVHAVGARALNPHKMKTDAEWLHVAACFDERGLKEIPAGL